MVAATFLPEVAYEQNWTQQETISHLVSKSGFRYKLTPEVQSQIICTRYQSSKHYLKYEEYVTMNDTIPLEEECDAASTQSSGGKGWRDIFNM